MLKRLEKNFYKLILDLHLGPQILTIIRIKIQFYLRKQCAIFKNLVDHRKRE